MVCYDPAAVINEKAVVLNALKRIIASIILLFKEGLTGNAYYNLSTHQLIQAPFLEIIWTV